MSRTWIIIQARTSSQRLREKVIKPIDGLPLISHVIKRVKYSKHGQNVCLATTDEKRDDILEALGRKEGIYVFRGDREDVLSRYYYAAKETGATDIVRITGDCPLIDPKIVDAVSAFYFEKKADYASNIHPPTYPDGLDVEIFSFCSLERAHKKAKRNYQREHVTPFIWKNREIFKIANFYNEKDLSSMRWIVDEDKDLRFVREIYKRIKVEGNEIFYMNDILRLLERERDLMEINAGITRNEGFYKSLKKENLI